MNYVEEMDAKKTVKLALKEDIGCGDITTQAFIPAKKIVKGEFLAKEDLVVCGLGLAAFAIRQVDKTVRFKANFRDGDFVKKGTVIASIKGRARGILTAERVALNFLSLLSGISTKTRQFVKAIKPYNAKIVDTRKTIPGLRLLQKYAVRVGGGHNHRLALDEMLLLKDNHLRVIGGISRLSPLRSRYKTEIEVVNLKEFKAALRLGPDVIMLDNMPIIEMKKAVNIRNSRFKKPSNPFPKLEASGGITLDNVNKIASTGVDMISIGGLTHSVKAVDISLEIG